MRALLAVGFAIIASQTIEVQDEGVRKGNARPAINCSGTGVDCTITGSGVMQLTVGSLPDGGTTIPVASYPLAGAGQWGFIADGGSQTLSPAFTFQSPLITQQSIWDQSSYGIYNSSGNFTSFTWGGSFCQNAPVNHFDFDTGVPGICGGDRIMRIWNSATNSTYLDWTAGGGMQVNDDMQVTGLIDAGRIIANSEMAIPQMEFANFPSAATSLGRIILDLTSGVFRWSDGNQWLYAVPGSPDGGPLNVWVMNSSAGDGGVVAHQGTSRDGGLAWPTEIYAMLPDSGYAHLHLNEHGHLETDSHSDGFVLTSNSTTTPLGSGATFTGTAFDLLHYGTIRVSLYTDKASATNGFQLQFSNDGTNWDFVRRTTINAGETSYPTFNRIARWFRVVYTNGNQAQNTFRLQTIVVPNSPEFSRVFADETPSGNTSAIVTSSMLYGLSSAGGGSYVQVKVNPSGAINTDTTGTVSVTGYVPPDGGVRAFQGPSADGGILWSVEPRRATETLATCTLVPPETTCTFPVQDWASYTVEFDGTFDWSNPPYGNCAAFWHKADGGQNSGGDLYFWDMSNPGNGAMNVSSNQQHRVYELQPHGMAPAVNIVCEGDVGSSTAIVKGSMTPSRALTDQYISYPPGNQMRSFGVVGGQVNGQGGAQSLAVRKDLDSDTNEDVNEYHLLTSGINRTMPYRSYTCDLDGAGMTSCQHNIDWTWERSWTVAWVDGSTFVGECAAWARPINGDLGENDIRFYGTGLNGGYPVGWVGGTLPSGTQTPFEVVAPHGTMRITIDCAGGTGTGTLIITAFAHEGTAASVIKNTSSAAQYGEGGGSSYASTLTRIGVHNGYSLKDWPTDQDSGVPLVKVSDTDIASVECVIDEVTDVCELDIPTGAQSVVVTSDFPPVMDGGAYLDASLRYLAFIGNAPDSTPLGLDCYDNAAENWLVPFGGNPNAAGYQNVECVLPPGARRMSIQLDSYTSGSGIVRIATSKRPLSLSKSEHPGGADISNLPGYTTLIGGQSPTGTMKTAASNAQGQLITAQGKSADGGVRWSVEPYGPAEESVTCFVDGVQPDGGAIAGEEWVECELPMRPWFTEYYFSSRGKSVDGGASDLVIAPGSCDIGISYNNDVPPYYGNYWYTAKLLQSNGVPYPNSGVPFTQGWNDEWRILPYSSGDRLMFLCYTAATGGSQDITLTGKIGGSGASRQFVYNDSFNPVHITTGGNPLPVSGTVTAGPQADYTQNVGGGWVGAPLNAGFTVQPGYRAHYMSIAWSGINPGEFTCSVYGRTAEQTGGVLGDYALLTMYGHNADAGTQGPHWQKTTLSERADFEIRPSPEHTVVNAICEVTDGGASYPEAGVSVSYLATNRPSTVPATVESRQHDEIVTCTFDELADTCELATTHGYQSYTVSINDVPGSDFAQCFVKGYGSSPEYNDDLPLQGGILYSGWKYWEEGSSYALTAGDPPMEVWVPQEVTRIVFSCANWTTGSSTVTLRASMAPRTWAPGIAHVYQQTPPDEGINILTDRAGASGMLPLTSSTTGLLVDTRSSRITCIGYAPEQCGITVTDGHGGVSLTTQPWAFEPYIPDGGTCGMYGSIDGEPAVPLRVFPHYYDGGVGGPLVGQVDVNMLSRLNSVEVPNGIEGVYLRCDAWDAGLMQYKIASSNQDSLAPKNVTPIMDPVAGASNPGGCTSVSTASVTVLASYANRKHSSICADSDNTKKVYIRLGLDAGTSGFPLAAGQCMSPDNGAATYTGPVSSIAASGTQSVCAWEF